MKTKVCNKCHEEKSFNDFYNEARMPDGKRKQCKACQNEKTQKWRDKNTDEYNAYMRKYNEAHPQSKKQKEAARFRVLKARYGITREEWDSRYANQNGLCKICQKRHAVVVDHCHNSNRIRGLLCHGCNVGIAILDNPERLAAALKYRDSQS